MSFDLNLENYDLNDLLNIFKLNYNFNIDDLKEAKKIVLKTHPDKSGLSNEYFLFYCKAFKIIKKLYDFKNKNISSLNNTNSKIEYLKVNDEDPSNKLLVTKLLETKTDDFNKWFNETFEKINIIDEEKKNGYGHWFKSNDDIDNTSTTLNSMHEKIIEKKKTMSSLIKKQDIKEFITSNSYQGLDGSIPESYGSNIFSKLQYEDLKIAHTETVVPVSDHDYNNVLKFNNVELLKNYRNSQNIKPMNKIESENYYINKAKKDDEININFAYKLMKQDENMEKANKNWWANLKLLK